MKLMIDGVWRGDVAPTPELEARRVIHAGAFRDRVAPDGTRVASLKVDWPLSHHAQRCTLGVPRPPVEERMETHWIAGRPGVGSDAASLLGRPVGRWT